MRSITCGNPLSVAVRLHEVPSRKPTVAGRPEDLRRFGLARAADQDPRPAGSEVSATEQPLGSSRKSSTCWTESPASTSKLLSRAS